jgi:hypothetical protein
MGTVGNVRAVSVVIALSLGAVACSGSTGSQGPAGSPGAKGDPGPVGTPAVDHGGIAGTVKDPSGVTVAGASVSTVPPTVSALTDASGNFSLTSIPIGAYGLVAAKSGYVNGTLAAVGVGAGASVQVSLVLVPTPPTVGSVSGKIFAPSGFAAPAALAGAQVCVEGTTVCATSGSDGTYTLSGITPGFVFFSAVANGYLLGETRQAVDLAAGGAVTGVDITLSGQPPASATYVGSSVCLGCHGSSGVVMAWQASAHATVVDRTTGHLDVAGWPAAAANCSAPNVADSKLTANDPNPAINAPREVFLVRYGVACTPAFAMAFDSNMNGKVDLDGSDTIMPVDGSIGGVAMAAGQCGTGGVVPANTPCSANYLGSTGPVSTSGWWQQEYLVNIGPGVGKPAWVTWDTSGTPTDALALPLAWNQRQQVWVPGPDYNPTQAGTFSKVCAGCHDTGPSLTTDSLGNVTSYSSASPGIGCERCHGPGSAHIAGGGDVKLIVNPAYLTAQSSLEMCGQCHVNGGVSTNPAGAFDFSWNAAGTPGHGNFIPGVHKLSDFQSIPAYGDPGFYWPSGFPSIDHTPYMDLQGSVHGNNPYQKLTCADCHEPHGLVGGPYQFQRTAGVTGDQFAFQQNTQALANDVVCLACHASHGSFAAIALSDVAGYQLSTGGAVLKNGTALSMAASDQAASANLVASTVDAHMFAKAGMYAFFDPTATSGMSAGRCGSCHMAKTSWTAAFYPGPDANGRTANVIGDVSSHVFAVATPQMSLATVSGATTWDGVMPNACGGCHPSYRFGK